MRRAIPVTNSFSVLDIGLGVTDRALTVARRAVHGAREGARGIRPLVAPVVTLSRRAPLPAGTRPTSWLVDLGTEGATARRRLLDQLGSLADALVPRVVAEVVSRVDLTELVTRHVDLDEVVGAVDLDRAVAEVDIEAVIRRVDVDAVVAMVDLGAVIDRIDVDAVVARADLGPVIDRVDVGAVLDHVDLTSVVLERVDLDAVVQAVLARLDLVGLAEQVIDGVDLAGIIRESTGSMASDTVQEVRMQGIAADDAVSHAMDRLLLRHGRRSTTAPGALGARGAGAGPGTTEDHPTGPRERVP